MADPPRPVIVDRVEAAAVAEVTVGSEPDSRLTVEPRPRTSVEVGATRETAA